MSRTLWAAQRPSLGRRLTVREQVTKLAAEVAAIESELAELATTRSTLTKNLVHEVTTSELAIISEPYQQILAVFTRERGGGLRAKDVRLALGIGTEPRTPKAAKL